jgi:hypothetical protein
MFPEFDGTQACATMDQEVFFPVSLADTRKSLQFLIPICKSCSMYTKCAEYSRTAVGIQGIWAGVMYDGAGYSTPLDMTGRLKGERRSA